MQVLRPNRANLNKVWLSAAYIKLVLSPPQDTPQSSAYLPSVSLAGHVLSQSHVEGRERQLDLRAHLQVDRHAEAVSPVDRHEH
jgi:hypothetical protein